MFIITKVINSIFNETYYHRNRFSHRGLIGRVIKHGAVKMS